MTYLLRSSLLAACFALHALAAFGQPKSEIRFGELFKEPPHSTITQTLGIDNNRIYLLRQPTNLLFAKNEISVECYDYQINNIYRKALVFDEINDKKPVLRHAFYADEQIHTFSSVYSSGEARPHTIYYESFDAEALRPLRNRIEVGKVKSSPTSNLRIAHSPDESKVLIFMALEKSKEKKEQFALYVYNREMTLQLWGLEVELPYEAEDLILDDFVVNDLGEVFLTARKRDLSPENKALKIYDYVLLAYTQLGAKADEYPLAPASLKVLTETSMQLAPDGQLQIAGLYVDRKKMSQLEGVAFLRINPSNGVVLNSSQAAFQKDQLLELAGLEASSSKNPRLFSYDLKETFVEPDGSATLVAEQFYITTSYNASTRTWTTFYNYNHILVIRLDPQGQVEWLRRIGKIQVTANDGGYFSSYTLGRRDGELSFVFNDNPANASFVNAKKIKAFNGRSSTTVRVRIGADGKASKETLFTNKGSGIITRPKISAQLSEDAMMLYGEYMSKARLGLLRL